MILFIPLQKVKLMDGLVWWKKNKHDKRQRFMTKQMIIVEKLKTSVGRLLD